MLTDPKKVCHVTGAMPGMTRVTRRWMEWEENMGKSLLYFCREEWARQGKQASLNNFSGLWGQRTVPNWYLALG